MQVYMQLQSCPCGRGQANCANCARNQITLSPSALASLQSPQTPLSSVATLPPTGKRVTRPESAYVRLGTKADVCFRGHAGSGMFVPPAGSKATGQGTVKILLRTRLTRWHRKVNHLARPVETLSKLSASATNKEQS